ncbi:hypothetical protein CCP3SC15_1670002 [Gammaproteobacteria bacterium]
MERPLRLHSQLTRQRIETLRYASGNEDIRAALYDQLGDALFEKPAAVREKLEQLVNDWGKSDSDEEDEEGEAETPRKSLSDKKKKKLLNEATWKRGAQLIETATKLRASSRRSTSLARPSPIRCAACSRRRSTARPASLNTNPIVNCVISNKSRCSRMVALRSSSAAKSCPTRPMPGSSRPTPKIGYETSFTRHFYGRFPSRG